MGRKFIGLMSGTSCDGIDAALVDIEGQGLGMKVKYLDHCGTPYPELLRRELLSVMAPARTRTEDLARLNVEVGYRFSACAKELITKAGMRSGEITAIGSHGQTICHMPKTPEHQHGATLQIGEPSIIAAQAGIRVVADFRPSDLAVGGQGAPLVPWTDYVLFRSERSARCLQNIGGIANVTYLPAGGGPERVIAFDTGPGCMVIDELVKRASKKKYYFDPMGKFAARGQPDLHLVDQLMALPFFQQAPPKSAGREQFGKNFTNGLLKMIEPHNPGKYDIIATATLLTARSIAHAYQTQLSADTQPAEVILCGGGSRNKTLIDFLQRELPRLIIKTTDQYGIPVQAKECVSFAMLAAACLDGIPANLPQVTGASRPAILGKIVRV